ncbi:MAG TPA: minor capsid protein [Methanothrix sp.]|mgnify:CR=1 FL=1|nr:minor capsid protein [Methanothrix soehngenii]HPM27343.1 minor capsid protein [Methanothrix sp.]
MSFLEDIATQLNSLGIGVYPGTASTQTVFIGYMPDSPDAVVSLYARPGRSKEVFCDLQYPDLHIEIRAATYGAAQTKAEAIDAALHAQHDITLSTHRYLLIRGRGVPCKLETDSRGRTIFYQNFEIMKGA